MPNPVDPEDVKNYVDVFRRYEEKVKEQGILERYKLLGIK